MLKKLTNAQKNMYDTQKFFNDTSICNIGGCVFFRNNIDIDLLKKSINMVIKNADGLRIRIKEENLEAMQYIVEYEQEEIEVLDVSEKECNEVLEKLTQEKIDILGKLYDFRIIKTEYRIGVYIKLHHLVSDAWSTALVVKKIVDYYKLLSNNEEIECDIPSYLDFIDSEEKYDQSEKYLDDKKYWEEKYDKKPTYVTMAPSKQTTTDVDAKRLSFDINGELSSNIYKYCEENSISLSILFEAITTIYSSRINNSKDVTLCSVVINRNGFAQKNTIGMFNNILPLTIDIPENLPFISFCQDISTKHYEIFRHQKYPLEDIMKYVREKFGNDTNLYDIMVSYQNAQIDNEVIDDAKWLFNGTSDLGFMINISNREGNDNIHVDIDFRKNLFEENEAINIYNRMLNMLDQVLHNENVMINDIEIVTNEEKNQILNTFNNTEKEYPKDKNLIYFLEKNVNANPEKTALIFKNSTITFKEFNEKVNSLARYIQEKVSQKNCIIGVMLERSFEMLISIYAILKAGHAYMPIDPHFPADRIKFMIEDSKTPIILSDTKWNLENLEEVEKLDLDKFDYDKYENTNLNTKIEPTDTAYVIYTSGSTGKPKGAMIAHHSAINRIKWMHEKYPLLDGNIILQKTPYTFDVSVWELFWWSMYVQTLDILIPEGHKDPSEMVEEIYKNKVTHMHFVPSMLNVFMEYLQANEDKVDKLKSLKYVFVSGEALQVEHVKKFYKIFEKYNITLHNLYGPTECTVDVSYYDCERECNLKNIPIGKPVDNTQLLILDDTYNLLPIGTVGQLYISGVLVGKGYINRDELTKEKFVENKYYNYPTMYKTGDLAKWLPDGNIEYCGRTDFQVKIRGLRVELGDIENAILQYNDINQVIVTIYEYNNEKNICAYYTANSKIDEAKLKEELLKKLPNYMVPQYFIQLDEMPKNNNGKIDRKQLPTPTIENKNEEYVKPANENEKLLYGYIKEILGIDDISCNSNLFDYGLTSLGVISLMIKLSTSGYEFKVSDFYKYNTIQQIAQIMDKKEIKEKEDNYEDDIENYSDVSDIENHSLPIKNSNAILLTGATSYLGIHIIEELIKNTDKYVFCLIRNKEKFIRFIHKYTTLEYPNNRLICVNGDITKEDIGFDKAMASSMKDKISDIIHCAADVSFFCSWERSKQINYIGTCNVLKFAKDAKAKLHHISTMSVSGDILTGQTKQYPTFTEKDLYIGQLYKENVYAHSKYLAEKEIIKAIRNDEINASIYRIANLTWRASDGLFQENYQDNDLYILTSVMKQYKMIPEEIKDENLAMLPVDDAAKVIVKLLNYQENHIYNLYSKNSLNIEQLVTGIVDDDISMKSMEEFKNTLIKDKNNDFANFVLTYVSKTLNDKSNIVKFNNDYTNNILNNIDFKWSDLENDYAQFFNKIGGNENDKK